MKGPRTSDRELLGISVVAVLSNTVYYMVSPLVPIMLKELNASPSLLGLVISVSAIGSLFIGVSGGVLLNYWGSRKIMQVFGSLMAFSCFFLTVFPTIGGLFIGLIVFEMGKILFVLGSHSHVASLGEDRDQNMDFGWYTTMCSIGQMIGPLLVGIWIDAVGVRTSWFLIGVFAAGTSLALFVLISGGIGKIPQTAQKEEKKPKSLVRLFSPYALIAILVSFMVFFADGARTTFYPILLRDFGYSATMIGLFLSLRGFVSMGFRIFMGRFLRAVGGTFPAVIISLFFLALGIGTTPFCRGSFLLTVNAVLVGIGLGIALPLSVAMVSTGTDPEDRGVAMGIRLTGNRLAQLINPVFFGALAHAFGLVVAFVSGGLMLFGSSLPILFWWRGEKLREKSSGF